MATQRPQARSTRLHDTERVIVTRWDLAPGTQTGWHRHAHDYVIVCLTAGTLLAETANGNVETRLAFGETYARPAGVEHNIVNPGPEAFAFIEIEIR